MSWKVQPSSKPRKDGTCKLEIEYCYKGRNLPINIGKIYCKPSDWSKDSQSIVSGYEREERNSLNRLVDAAKQKMSHIINQLAIDDFEPTHENVKKMWEKPIIENKKKIEDLLPMYEKWSDAKSDPKYSTTLPYLKEFSEIRGGVRVADVSIKLLDEFCRYLCEYGILPEEKQKPRVSKNGKPIVKGSNKKKAGKKVEPRLPFANTTLRNHVKYFKLFFKEYLSPEGYDFNQNYRDYKYHFSTPEVTDVIALYKSEFDRIFWYPVDKEKHPHLRVAQVAFVVGTLLGGLRPSDLYKLSESSFETGNVKFYQQKTKGKVDNPLAEAYLTKEYLEEFLFYNTPVKNKTGKLKKPIPAPQKVNDNLKVLAELAGLDREADKTMYYGGSETPTIERVNIKSHISLQYMRKSFISILVEEGIRDRDVIKSLSGHKDGDMIDHYLAIHDHTKKLTMDILKPSPNPFVHMQVAV